ncbi:hypothetical protein UlMin_009229 [Ulmus minor]
MAATLPLTPLVSAPPRNKSKNMAKDNSSVGNCKTMDELKKFHCSITKKGLNHRISDLTALIATCSEMGTSESLDYARKAFEFFKEDERSKGTLYMYNSLIRGYSGFGLGDEAILLYVEMVVVGIVPDKYSFPFVLSGCAKVKAFSEGVQFHGVVVKMGLDGDLFVRNSLIHFYAECGELDDGQKVFDEMPERNVVSWTSLICEKSLVLYNTMLSNYVRQGLAREALDMFGEMARHGPRPDKVTLLSAISACSQLGDSVSGKWCHSYALRNGLEGWDNISNAMIDMYTKFGKQDMACKIFDLMPNKTIVSWNSLIAGFIRSGDVVSAWEKFNAMPESDLVSWNTMIGALVQENMFEEALQLFQEMQNKGVKTDRVTMVEVASACGYLGALVLAKWVHTFIEKNEIQCDLQLETALVDMFARCGDPQSAMQVFNNMSRRDVSAWTAAIGAMAMEGNSKRAMELFDEMLRQGVKPDGVVFVALLTACSHGGCVELGRKIFTSMKPVHGISPGIVHYGCMVDLLGRAGLLREASDVIKNMPMEPNDVVWGSFLAACRTHDNIEMATFAAERINELASNRSGIHVLLSNIYASAGKWSDVAKVRLHLKEKGISKVPGTSSIEVDGIVHEFTSGDDSHPEENHIGSMLEEISCRLKDAGHVPDLANVLLDVNEHEKEFFLSRHSEKLAMAFGLISTSQGVPIHVVKNLRICSDCHTFAKLVSKIYGREIVIRDNHRFHFFRQGVCSCRDYW